MNKGISRRTFMAGAGIATGMGLMLPKGAWAQSAKLPSSPVA
ncbi:MAG: twin-arginine translocation signal domain-containing protein, partial [Brucella intermedia]